MPETPVRILLIEDDKDDYVRTRGLLDAIPQYTFEVRWTRQYEEALNDLASGLYDVALVDYRLGERDVIALIREARAQGCHQPIILLTGQIEREIDVAAAAAGASEYLNKSEVTAPVLERAIRYTMQNAKLEEQRARLLAERAARAEAEAGSRAKDQFLASLSHELRTPLTPVLISIAALSKDTSLSSSVRDDLEMIRRNVEMEARLIDDLLDLTRIQRGTLELRRTQVNIDPKLENVLNMCRPEAEAKRIEIVVRKNALRPMVEGDPARVQQIIWNLVRNAIKFTPDGGRVEIATADEGDDIVLTVKDSGVGIEPHPLARIFDAFMQGGRQTASHTGGLGLGLTISKALTNLHHGQLLATSEGAGRGAMFTLKLPAMKQVAPPVDAPAEQPAQTSRRILFVEDHADTAMALARVLGRNGYHVSRADSVAAAVKLIDAEMFDLLISDIGLPDGSGLDVMRHLKQKQPTPGIAVSGYGMEGDIASAKEAGFARHLIKPVHPDLLLAAVAETIETANPKSEARNPNQNPMSE